MNAITLGRTERDSAVEGFLVIKAISTCCRRSVNRVVVWGARILPTERGSDHGAHCPTAGEGPAKMQASASKSSTTMMRKNIQLAKWMIMRMTEMMILTQLI